MPTAAFFDLDNTLLHGASLFLIGRGMRRHGFVSTPELLRGGWQQLVFRLVGERQGHVAGVQQRSLAFGAGLEVAPLVRLGEQLFDEYIADRILTDTLALAQAHLDRGDDVYVVTAAPVELAEIVARRLGFTGALGTVSEVVEGRWTGRLIGDLLHGQAKADAVRELAVARGYDLRECAAYSDSINDTPLLTCVGAAHAVNPDRRLRALAHSYGWPIHDFRRARRVITFGLIATGAASGAAVATLWVHRQRRRGPRAAATFTLGATLGYLRAASGRTKR